MIENHQQGEARLQWLTEEYAHLAVNKIEFEAKRLGYPLELKIEL